MTKIQTSSSAGAAGIFITAKNRKQILSKDYLWEKLIEKHSEENVTIIINSLADLADGKKRIRRSK